MKYIRLSKDNTIETIDIEKMKLTNIYDKKVGNFFNTIGEIKQSKRDFISKLYTGDFKLAGKYKITFVPEIGDKYFYYENPNKFGCRLNNGSLLDILNIKIGNAFKDLIEPEPEVTLNVCKCICSDAMFEIRI